MADDDDEHQFNTSTNVNQRQPALRIYAGTTQSCMAPFPSIHRIAHIMQVIEIDDGKTFAGKWKG